MWISITTHDLELVYASRVTVAGPGNHFGVVSVSDIPNDGNGTETWTLEASDEANVMGAVTFYDMTVMDSTLYLFRDNGDVHPVTYSGGVWTIEPVLVALIPNGSWWSAQTVDINNDGTEEIVVASWNTTRKVYLLQGSGATLAATEIADLTTLIGATARIYGTHVGDLDNDGNMDFVFGSRGATPNAAITRLEYQGGDIASSGSYTSKLMDANYAAGGRWMHISVSDLDGDGNDEVIYGEGTAIVPPAPLVILKGGAGAVTFSVDMGVQVFKGLFDPSTQDVVIRGDFQVDAGDAGGNWQGAYFEMADADGDTIYTLTVLFPDSTEGKSYEHKFVIPDPETWEGAPNRPFTVAAPNVILPTVWFGDDSSYLVPVTNTIDFTADISGILGIGAGGAFDDAQDSLLVNGLDWDGLGTLISPAADRRMVKDLFTPGIYTTSLTFKGTADSTKWKFKAYPDARFSNGGWETTPDRWYVYQADGSTTVLPTIVPNIQPLYDPIASDVDIIFTVDLTDAVNRYNDLPIPLNELEFVGIRGSADFLGSWITGGNWVPSDTVDGLYMKVLTDIGNNQWQVTLTAPAGTPGGVYSYKFAAMYPGADTINSSSSPLDNEAPSGINHDFTLVDSPTPIIQDVLWLTRATDVQQIDDMIPGTFELAQNYPNPFNPSTTIRYNLPEAGFVTLKVFNALGEEVALLVNQEQTAGVFEATFDASFLSSGIYFYRMESGTFVDTKKMILVK